MTRNQAFEAVKAASVRAFGSEFALGTGNPRLTSDTGLPTAAAGVAVTGARPQVVQVFTAVREQLGLRLEARKETFAVLVIDHVEMPTAN